MTTKYKKSYERIKFTLNGLSILRTLKFTDEMKEI